MRLGKFDQMPVPSDAFVKSATNRGLSWRARLAMAQNYLVLPNQHGA